MYSGSQHPSDCIVRQSVDRFHIPSTVSTEAAARLRALYAVLAARPRPQQPVSMNDFDRVNAEVMQRVGPIATTVADHLGIARTDVVIDGVPVLRLRPPQHCDHGLMLLYTHGGSYIYLSAATSLIVPSLIAVATGHEVISIDYTIAPRGNWTTATNEVLTVWNALLRGGMKPKATGIFGDSAGGGLAVGSVLKMRDEGLPLPGAIYLLSPWADLTGIGDTVATLADADPSIRAEFMTWGANAYANPSCQKHPYVSPVYGNYAKPFPPTLIQAGTREVLLSDAIRQYQAISAGGKTAVLDIYEGMPHVFQALLIDTPEDEAAVTRAAQFFNKHLKSVS